MKYSKVKELDVSRVVLGVGSYGSSIPDAEGEMILRTFMERGGNAVDTGNVYANWVDPANRSASEKMLGRLFKTNPGLREKLVVCTKGAHYEWYDPAKTPRVNEGCIRYDVDASLQNMGIARIDLYWLHRDNPTYPVNLIMDALFEAQDAGKIGHFGASNWSARRIMEANSYARSCGREGFFGSQIMYSYALPIDVGDRTTMYFDEALEGSAYLAERLALFCYTSQARGYISKTLAGTPLRPNIAHDFDCQTNRERAARAQEVAAQIGGGHSAEQVGLAYLHALPYNVFSVVGCHSVEQIIDSVGSTEFDLTPAQIEYLAKDTTAAPFVPQLGH
jgi:aryl-alcohol dehydrogenase-like predicted oxidoreductase